MLARAHASTLRRWLKVETLEDRSTPAVVNATAAFVPGQVLVTLSDGVGTSALTLSPLTDGVEEVGFGVLRVNLQPGVTVEQAVAAFSTAPGVVAEPNYLVSVTATPNDTRYANGDLWGLNNTGQNGGTADADIDAAEAWDVATGTGTTIVAVIDSGVDYNHPDLDDNMWVNPGEVAGNGLDDDGNGYVDDVHGINSITGSGDPMDDNDHGTHCAGTIGAEANNSTGVVGVAWQTQIMAVKFLGAGGTGSYADAIESIEYAVENGATILSNSWGGTGASAALNAAIEASRAAGCIFVAAAGNGGADLVGDNNDTTPFYPANAPSTNVISVAATNRNDARAGFSNYGAATVDLAAPGVGIWSTTPGNTYSNFDGTSMATPHVSGALAVFWDANPSLTAQQVIDALYASVDPVASMAGITTTGGRLNLNNLLAQAPAVDTEGPAVVSSDFFGAQPKTFDTVRVVFDEAIDAGTFDSSDVELYGPNGNTISTTVTAVAGTDDTFDVTFAPQTQVGYYYAYVGPGVEDLAGNEMDQSGDGINGQWDDYFFGYDYLANSGARIVSSQFTGPTATTFNKLLVTFDEPVQANTFTATDVKISRADGKALSVVSVKPVSGQNITPNTVFELLLGTQPAPGTYTVKVGPAIRDTSNLNMDQDADGISGESQQDVYVSTHVLNPPARQTIAADIKPNQPKAIPDKVGNVNGKVVVPIVVNSNALTGFAITDVNVGLTISHTWVGDLRITLTAPTGQTVTLVNRLGNPNPNDGGNSGDNFIGTTFDDEANTSINAGSAPFSGVFRPETPLTAFDGLNPIGTWKLTVYDEDAGIAGTVQAVKLNIGVRPSDAGGGPLPAGNGGGAGGGVAGFGSPSAPPTLSAPPASGGKAAQLAAPPADAGVVVERRSIAPLFGGMSTSEPGSADWLALSLPTAWSGFDVQ